MYTTIETDTVVLTEKINQIFERYKVPTQQRLTLRPWLMDDMTNLSIQRIAETLQANPTDVTHCVDKVNQLRDKSRYYKSITSAILMDVRLLDLKG